MKTRRYEGNDLRRVLAGMVTDQTVAARVASKWTDDGLFDSGWANLVGGWVVDYVRKYGSPPNGQLRSLYERWADGREVEDSVARGVERFLQYVSDEFQANGPVSSDYLLDVAGRYFTRVRANQLLERATEEMEGGRAEDAVEQMARASRVELGAGALIKPAEEYEPWAQAFDPERRRPLVEYSGGLERFFGDTLSRDSLVAFMAPDKSAKSFWIMDVAYRGLKGRKRVAYFEAGDLLQDEVLMRIGQRAAMRPWKAGKIRWPTAIDDEGATQFEERRFSEELTPSGAYKAFRRVCRGRDVFRLSCHPNNTLTVDAIRGYLSDWEREEWVPDIVVIDYADILAPPVGYRETIDQEDAKWKLLRRLSQEMHCLVVTATQSNAAAYSNAGTLGRKHFSGRKTKLAHVNAMVGINYNDDDKEAGIQRLNWVVRRNASYREGQAVRVAGCLALACPAVVSRL